MKATLLKLILLFTLFALASCQTAGQKQIEDDKNKRAELHYKLGLDAIHKGFIPKAFEELYISDEIHPDQPETLDAIAYAWRLRDNPKKSEVFYKRAIEAGAGSATFNNYGSLLVELKKYKQAIQNLNLALEDPRYRNQGLVFINMGDAYVGLNNLEEAVKSYRKAGMITQNTTFTQLKEAAAYTIFNRPNYAQALYETILRREPINQQALSALIHMLKGKGQDSVLHKYIQTFINKTPNELDKAWAKDELALLQQG